MTRILYLQASPRAHRSTSIAVADAFVDAWRKGDADADVLIQNLFEMALPAFDGAVLEAKYAILHGRPHSPEQAQAWKAVEAVIEAFKQADLYLMAVPMWNFGIPYRLKHYLDVLIQPGYTFSFDAETGYQGLVKGKPIVLVYARGGSYPPGTPAGQLDLQTCYLEQVLRFIGFEDIRSIVVEPTLEGTREAQERVRVAGIEMARAAGRDF